MDSNFLFYVMNIPMGYAIIFIAFFLYCQYRRDIFYDIAFIIICLCMIIDCINYSGHTIYDVAILFMFMAIGFKNIYDINPKKKR